MAKAIAVSTALLVLLLIANETSSLVGPQSPYGIPSARIRRPATPPCPQGCLCSSDAVSCDQRSLGSLEGHGIKVSLPPRTRMLSLASLSHWGPGEEAFLAPLEELRWLRISDGELIELPSIPVLPGLEFLDLSGNLLEYLPSDGFRHLSSLVHLNISRNNLSAVSSGALNGLSDIRELDLSQNRFEKPLPADTFAPTHKLQFLDLSNCYLTNFSSEWVSSLQELRLLNLSNNNITALPDLGFPLLEMLDISHNPLLSLHRLSGFPALKQLFASHTTISHVKASDTDGCNQLQIIDLSYSYQRNINEDVFGNCKQLIEINLSHNPYLWRVEHEAFSNLENLAILRLNRCPKLYDLEENVFNDLKSLRELHLQESGIKLLPYSLNKLKNLSLLNIEGTSLFCDCYAHRLPELLNVSKHHLWKGTDVIQCTDGIKRTPESLGDHLLSLGCSEVVVNSPADQWVLTPWGKSAILPCNVTGYPTPKIVWQTVNHHLHMYNKSMQDYPWTPHQIAKALSVAETGVDGKFQVLKSGQLLIRNVTREEIGRYKCFAFNAVSNSSVVAFLGIDDSQFRAFILESILFGVACAALFFFVTILVQFMKYIMDRMGWECCCCKNRLSPKAKQIRQLIESVESYKSAQLEKLRENYTTQVVNIKDSCYQQMERLRESYAQQSKNLRDLCDYSTQQITGARDQYLDQVNKVRDYSMSQMNRVRENYVFQRNRIRKFSGHQLLRLRETYKYQQKTLNKLLETLPDLYIQNCRTGSCQRTDSLVFDDEIDGLDVYYKVDFLMDSQSQSSDYYYTPNSTLTRQSKGFKKSHSREASSISGGTEYHEAHSWVVRQESSGSERSSESSRFHIRSLSITTPPSGLHRLDGYRGHTRSISASSHPSPQMFHPRPLGLLKENGDASNLSSVLNSPKSSSKETPLYTPLTLTPVHDPKLYVKQLENTSGIYTPEDNEGESNVTEPSHTKTEEQKTIPNCDSDTNERENNCENDCENDCENNCDSATSSQTAYPKRKDSYTSL